ncbi:response regulator [Butyrivibrio sp. DSM 10294]|uniref:response regulator transcription factor n=1 Tax=Butyrivibrio sp. DSM 10294 TaxID=2972457 RepID=UPI00234F431B|nr:response regulator [Butyrivibrio sp. DSM 10294]MDC7294737.1 response regulator [Butyrivibrio sp. DSM 10294]
MLKVFLAEDEFVIREGIKNNINWGEHGYEFCGEAGDGELAFSMIQKLQPDILITDIRMPFMDGLALSRMVKAEFPGIEIILLTGYEDFEYAKEAIRIGVASYLSKPISGRNLLTEIDHVADKIIEKRKEKEAALRYEQDMKEKAQLDKQEFFKDLVTGGRPLTYILDRAKKLSINILALRYNIVLVKIWSTRHDAGEYSGSVVKVEEKIDEIAARYNALVFDLNLEGKAILFRADSEEELSGNISSALSEMKEAFAKYKHIRYYGGVGQSAERLTDIPAVFNWASRAFAHQYLSSDSDFLYGSEEKLDFGKDNVILSEVDPKHIDRRLIREFLRRGDESETEFFMAEFFGGMGKNAMKSTMLRQYIAMDVYFCVAEFAESELKLSRSEIDASIPTAELMADEKTTCDYLINIVNKAIDLRKKTAAGSYRDVVNQVIEYIEEHYAEDELSLNQLAAVVNFSPNHLSAVFRQETGQPFIKYLTDFRMEKAKELLLSTSKRSNEVGLLVGYKDPHYFSFLFKKTQGVTTTQYRGAMHPEEG